MNLSAVAALARRQHGGAAARFMKTERIDLPYTFAWLLLVTAACFASLDADVRHVSAKEAKVMIDAGALVIDVRSRATAKSSHLPGAVLTPLEDLAATIASIEADAARPIVVYCSDGATGGPEAARILTRAGFMQVVNLESGFEGWRGAGLPMSGS
jgi:rhodanese-related sulfurtransferase